MTGCWGTMRAERRSSEIEVFGPSEEGTILEDDDVSVELKVGEGKAKSEEMESQRENEGEGRRSRISETRLTATVLPLLPFFIAFTILIGFGTTTSASPVVEPAPPPPPLTELLSLCLAPFPPPPTPGNLPSTSPPATLAAILSRNLSRFDTGGGFETLLLLSGSAGTTEEEVEVGGLGGSSDALA